MWTDKGLIGNHIICQVTHGIAEECIYHWCLLHSPEAVTLQALCTAERLQEQSCHRHKAVKGVSRWNAQHSHLRLSSVELASVLLLGKKIPEPERVSGKWHLNYVNVLAIFPSKLLNLNITLPLWFKKTTHSFITSLMRPGIPFVFWHEQKHNKACNRMGSVLEWKVCNERKFQSKLF